MGRSFLKQTAEILRTKQRRKHLKRAMVSLSVIVAMLTSYLLILPAVTMERDPICGQEEHTHTDECYEHRLICGKTEQDGQAETTQRVLSCAFTTHVHGESCYNADGQLICGYADYAIHTHDENCYDADGNLVCTLPEVKQHGHDGSCYATETVLACGQDESSVQTIVESSDPFGDGTDVFGSGDNNVYVGDSEGGHIHTEECYETKYTLTCGKDEIIPHTHTAECYDENGNLVCGRLEIQEHQHDENCFMTVTTEAVEGHTHTDECYEDVLICDKAEHEHTEECYPQEEAEDDVAEDEVAEGDAEAADTEETGEEVAGDTAAEEPVEDENNEEETAEEDVEELEVDAEGTDEETGDVSEEETQEDADTVEETETPSYVCGLEEHTHTDECLDEEGNVICGLEEHVHTDECLAAEVEEDAELVAMEPEVSKVLTAEGSDYTVEVTYTDEAQIPDNAVLSVREIEQGTEEYESYYQQAVEAVQGGDTSSLAFARFFDISFVVDGTEIEPAAAVAVKISYKDAVEVPEGSEVKSVHFGEETEVLDVQTNGADGTVEEVEFDANGFSVYGIVGTETISAPFTASDGNTYEVTVNYGKDADIPSNAKLEVSEVGENSSRYDGYVEQAAEAIDARTIDLQYVKLLDISIVDENGNKVELNAPVDVQIKLLDKDQAEETTQVVHFEGTDEIPVVMKSSVEGDAVNFSTDGFSIYAVVDEGNTGDYARMNLHFMNGSEEVATVIVKNSDTLEELEDIIYDPGAGSMHEGEIFKGWYTSNTYTIDNADDAMDIAKVRQWAEARDIEENEDVYLYAMIFKNYVVNYLDENGVGLGSENVMMAANATNPNVDYTIHMAYEPKDDEHDFQGWYVSEGETNIVSSNPSPTQDESGKNLYKDGTELVIKGNVTFSVNAPEGHWLVFDENGKGATYNAPQFVKSGDTPVEPNAQGMNRVGYSFGGWYKDKACTDGNEFDFSRPLEDKTTIYAKWTAAATANYTVIIWKQNVDGDGYDFAESITLTGNTGSNVSTVTSQGSGNNRYARINGTNKQYTGFHLNSFDSPVQIVPEGTSVVNVYYSRNQHTLTFQVPQGRNWTTIKTITALYQQNISNNFPIVGTNGITYTDSRWDPQSSTPYNEVLVFIDVMPDADVTFHRSTANYSTKYMHYYVEALPGQEATRTYNEKGFVLYKDLEANYNFFTEAEDYIDLVGFSKSNAYPPEAYNLNQTQKVDTVWKNSSARHVYCYYTRDSYPINYMDGVYVDGNNNPVTGQESRGQLGTSSVIYYQQDISSYNKGEDNYFKPEYEGYEFEGWYLDDACIQPYTFTTMPEGGITVYGKWRQVQYRVFLHPNADGDQSLDWGSATQEMNFRVSIDGTVSVPTGRRTEWEFVGWYTDPSLSASSHFNMDTKLNEDTVKTPYDKTVDMTDPMDKFGNGATYNSDITGWDDDNDPETPGKDRFWITKKLDLYAKWRAKIVGAKGIGVQFDAGQGKITVDGRDYQTYSDGNLYLDQAQAPTLAASTPDDPANWEFKYWVLQKWVADEDLPDGGYYEDTNIHLNPGDSFEVLKSYAHQVVSEYEDDGVTPKVATYTVQVRAQYKMKSQEGTPSHIYFYGNNHDKDGNPIQGVTIGEGGNEPKDEETYSNININQAYDILSIESVIGDSKLYEGYKFLGWAKNRTDTTPWATLNEDGETYTVIQHDNTTDTDLTLTQVTKIAADEKQPYEDLYAVWEIQKFKVSIKKEVVHGSGSDLTTPYTINYEYDKDQLEDGSVNLKDTDEQIVTRDVPYGTIVSVTETDYPAFDKTYTAKLTTDDQGVEIEPKDAETSGNGFKVTGDIIVTVTNTRKTQDFSFIKTLEASQIEGDSSPVADAIFVLIDPTDESEKYTGETSVDGVVSFEGVLFGTYTLRETSAPEGYATIKDHTVIVNENGASIQLDGEDIGEEGVYTINDPKAETGTITLVKVNEDGSKQLKKAKFEISPYDESSSEYRNPVSYTVNESEEITGLAVGTKYQLKETQAPDGYILLGDLYYFQINLNGDVQIFNRETDEVITDFSNMKIGLENNTITIKNEPGAALPHTGGSGTLPYTLGGIALIMASALMYGFRMRRRERRLN